MNAYSDICMNSWSLPSDGCIKPWPFWRQKETTLPENEGPAKILSDLHIKQYKFHKQIFLLVKTNKNS